MTRLLFSACLVLFSFYAFSAKIDPQVKRYCVASQCDTPIFYQYYENNKYRLCTVERPTLLKPRNHAILVAIAKKAPYYGLRSSVAVLPIMESSLNPFASAGDHESSAKGLWQFKPATARDMGLRVGLSVDERMDPGKASGAGLRYLQWLNEQFDGDHNLSILAYYIGVGRLQKLILKHGTRNPWFLSQMVSEFEPAKEYLMKYHSYTLSLMGKGC